MTNHFPKFARLVADTFQRLAKSSNVYVSGITPDDLYVAYLAAFPPGTDPIFKKRTEHDCGSCKTFIRRVGNIVTVADDGHVFTIWDDAARNAPAPYDQVATALRALVLAAPIEDLFRVSHKETSFGAATSRSQNKETLEVSTWDHFYTGQIPGQLQVSSPGEVCGSFRTTVEVFQRGLEELSEESVITVKGLIEANNLYRGEEHSPAVSYPARRGGSGQEAGGQPGGEGEAPRDPRREAGHQAERPQREGAPEAHQRAGDLISAAGAPHRGDAQAPLRWAASAHSK